MENELMNAGIDELNTLKEHLLELDGYKEKNEELIKEESRLEKVLENKEKALADEIEKTIKQRRNGIEASYQSQIDNLTARRKKIKAKKEKAKGMKVSERMQAETAELRDENKKNVLKIKALLKREKAPKFCNSLCFFALFLPKSVLEWLILALALLVVFFGLPFGIYVPLFAKKFGELALAIIYLIDVIVFGGLYLFVNNKVKEKHLEMLKEIRRLRGLCAANKRKIRLIEKGIRNDSDESTYGLEQFDSELKELEEELHKVTEEEKEVLTTFENRTIGEISGELRGRVQEELDTIRANCEETRSEQKKTAEKIKELTLLLSRRYEIYLGKDMMNIAKLDSLIGLMESGEASTIGEAVVKANTKEK